MWVNRVIRSTAPLLCATTLAGAAVVGHLDRSSDATTVTRGEASAFAGHPFRADAGCVDGELVTVRIRPVTVRGDDLMRVSFGIASATPGSHWTFGLEAEGGGSGEAADGEFTVRADGTATITRTARAAHVRQTFRLLAQEDAAVPSAGSKCELRTRVRY